MFKTGVEKLERMHPSTPDYSVVYNHLDFMLDLPWEEHTTDDYDLKRAKSVLDHDHYGMMKIKRADSRISRRSKIKGRHEKSPSFVL